MMQNPIPAFDQEEPRLKQRSVVKLSGEQQELSRNNYTQLLRSMQQVTDVAVADVFQVHKTTAGRWRTDGEFEFLANLLAALGLKAVSADEAYDPEVVYALNVLASKNVNGALCLWPEKLAALRAEQGQG